MDHNNVCCLIRCHEAVINRIFPFCTTEGKPYRHCRMQTGNHRLYIFAIPLRYDDDDFTDTGRGKDMLQRMGQYRFPAQRKKQLIALIAKTPA